MSDIGYVSDDAQSSVYHIDSQNCIIAFNDAWRAFAVENGAPELANDAVIGQPLWRYITNPETVHLYQRLLQSVRADRRPIRVPFRCDAPSLRRFMELEMAAEDNDGVRFSVVTLRLEARPPVVLLDAALARSGGMLRMCSWCKQIELGEGAWVEVEEAVRRLRLFDHATLPHITHGMCDACFARLYPKADDDD